jgi:dihydropteroate synthase
VIVKNRFKNSNLRETFLQKIIKPLLNFTDFINPGNFLKITNFVISISRYMKKLTLKDTFFSGIHSLNCRGKLLDLSRPAIMGILNVTSDSFYDGGKYLDAENIMIKVSTMVDDGADILDIGAMSTRPGSKPVPQELELKRLSEAMSLIRKKYPEIPVSVDTFRPEIAKKIILDYNADMINDITAGGKSEEMFRVVAELKVPYIIMHMQGNPDTMQKNPHYEDVVDEILLFLAEKTMRLRKSGVNDIIIDPGFGFGKTLDHNYQLLAHLNVFRSLELPILTGLSRKSMISRFLNTEPENALNGTTALNMYALTQGSNILRVHDVKEAVETRNLFCRLRESTLVIY